MSKRQSERGAVLLTTLLVMSIMAAVAVALIDDIRFGVKRAINAQAYAQADWYVKGAEDFAQGYLEQSIAQGSLHELNAALSASEPIVFPIDGGAISLSIHDGTQCLSLGALDQSPGRRQFRQLLIAIGWSDSEAEQMTASIADWMDADDQPMQYGAEDYVYMGKSPGYRPSNTAFSSVLELRAVDKMTEQKFREIRPFVCARGQGVENTININTLSRAQLPVLAAMLGSEATPDLASQILSERPETGFTDLEQLRATPALQDQSLRDAALEQFVFAPQYIFIEADVFYNGARRFAAYEYVITDDGVELVSRHSGNETFRPRLERPKI